LLLASIQYVDAVILFDEATPLTLIETILPDVLVKGGDYTVSTVVGANEVIAHGGKVELVGTSSRQKYNRHRFKDFETLNMFC
jgi:bifunctional ADP-heptose synthase (sugar kinase/adenylyltransferase)